MNTQILSFYRLSSRAASRVVLALSFLVLMRWLFGIPALKSILSGQVTRKRKSQRGDGLARVFATITMLSGLLPLGQYVFGRDFGIDQLLLKDTLTAPNLPPRWMSLVTALNFSLPGFAFLLLSNTRYPRLIYSNSIIVSLISILALMGYVYSASSLFRLFPYSSVAIHIAFAVFLLCLGIMKIFNSAERREAQGKPDGFLLIPES